MSCSAEVHIINGSSAVHDFKRACQFQLGRTSKRRLVERRLAKRRLARRARQAGSPSAGSPSAGFSSVVLFPVGLYHHGFRVVASPKIDERERGFRRVVLLDKVPRHLEHHQLEFALHLADDQLPVEIIVAGQYQELAGGKRDKPLRQAGEPSVPKGPEDLQVGLAHDFPRRRLAEQRGDGDGRAGAGLGKPVLHVPVHGLRHAAERVGRGGQEGVDFVERQDRGFLDDVEHGEPHDALARWRRQPREQRRADAATETVADQQQRDFFSRQRCKLRGEESVEQRVEVANKRIQGVVDGFARRERARVAVAARVERKHTAHAVEPR